MLHWVLKLHVVYLDLKLTLSLLHVQLVIWIIESKWNSLIPSMIMIQPLNKSSYCN